MTDPQSFSAAVRALFLTLRGKGLVLSPLDEARIQAWERGAVPLPLALEALRLAARARDEGGAAARQRGLRLSDAERHLDGLRRQAARRREGVPVASVAAPAAEPRSTLSAPLRERAATSAGPAAAAWFASADALERALGAGRPFAAALEEADLAQALGFLRAVPRLEQRRLAGAALRAAGARDGVPRRSFRATLRVHLGYVVRAEGRLARPSDLV